jgi:hypothetical protein
MGDQSAKSCCLQFGSLLGCQNLLTHCGSPQIFSLKKR